VANKKLSADRAAAVKDILVAQGIGATQVTSEGYGPEQPIASNDTEEGRARNRRVELVVLKG
jgi:outer membrane protein OmpA-like peptidoglycan-associated protein